MLEEEGEEGEEKSTVSAIFSLFDCVNDLVHFSALGRRVFYDKMEKVGGGR